MIFVHRSPGKQTGFWQSERPNLDFRDSGRGNQFIIVQFSMLLLYNDIGQTDTGGTGHVIDFSNADPSVLMLIGVNLRMPKGGDRGYGRMSYLHSKVLPSGIVEWEYRGQHLRRWQLKSGE